MLSQPTLVTDCRTSRRYHLPRLASACAAIDHLPGVYPVPAPAWPPLDPVCLLSAPQPLTTTLECLQECDAYVLSRACQHHSLLAPLFRGFDRLAVQDSGTWLRFSTCLHSQFCAQRVVDALPHASSSPLCEVPVDYLPGRQVSRQHPPGAPTPQQVEYGIGYLSKFVLAFASCMPRRWKQRLKQLPLLICKVAWIRCIAWCAHLRAHASSLPHPSTFCQCY